MIYLNQFFVDRVASPTEESVAHQHPFFIHEFRARLKEIGIDPEF
jgi:hypothetical protein